MWLDALTNYLSALGGPDTELSRQYWPHVLHLLGKDIVRFHAVYWPCFLLAAGWPLPKRMFVHGWWVGVDGQKMGKSLGNAIEPLHLARTYGRDCLRYFLMREGTFGTDNSFSEKAFIDRINGDLANDYGNLASRSLGMLSRYEAAVVPARGEADRDDDVLRAVYEGVRPELIRAMDELALQRALASIWELVRAANKYVDSTAPWVLARDPAKKARLREVLYTLCETLRIVARVVTTSQPAHHLQPRILRHGWQALGPEAHGCPLDRHRLGGQRHSRHAPGCGAGRERHALHHDPGRRGAAVCATDGRGPLLRALRTLRDAAGQ